MHCTLHFLLLLKVLSSFCASVANGLTILSPSNYSTHVLVPPAPRITIPIHYELRTPENHTMCLGLKLEETYIFQNYCVIATNNHLMLSDLPNGRYELQFKLENNESSNDLIAIYFSILDMENALPLLFVPSVLYFIANDFTNASDVTIAANLADSPLKGEVDVCIEIFSRRKPDNSLSPRACFASDQDTITLYNMLAGPYDIFFELQQNKAPYRAFKSSRVKTEVEVHTMDEIVPTLEVLNNKTEVGLNPSDKVANEVRLHVNIKLQNVFPFTEVLGHIDCCIVVAYSPLFDIVQPTYHCLPISPEYHNVLAIEFSLFKVPVGVHNFSLFFRSIHPPHRQFLDGAASGQVEVRRMEEFVPSYEWSTLHAWHTIPHGLQTRLPMGIGGTKQARIPEPWRLQVGMPHPCKFFLRMDMMKSTSVGEIKEAASSKCDAPSICFVVLAEDEILDNDTTVASGNLFSKSIRLDFSTVHDKCMNFGQ